MAGFSNTPSIQDPKGYDFRKLPPELRNRIYECVVIQQGSISLNQHQRRSGILQSCKQVRQESLPVYLGRNSFSFTIANMNLERSSQWINLLSEQDVRSLNRLSLPCTGRVLHDDNRPTFREWHRLIAQLYITRFKSIQISWSVKFRTELRAGRRHSTWGPTWVANHLDSAQENVDFVRHVLTPLLRTNNLLDANIQPEEHQIVQMLHLIRPDHAFHDAPIPKPSSTPRMFPKRPSHPENWYEEHLKQPRMDWAQRREAFLHAQDDLEAWHESYDHIFRHESFEEVVCYNKYIGQVQHSRRNESDEWEEILEEVKEAEEKKADFIYHPRDLFKIEKEVDYDLVEYETIDFEDDENIEEHEEQSTTKLED